MVCKKCGSFFGHSSICLQDTDLNDPNHYCDANDYFNPNINEYIITSEEHIAWLKGKWEWILNYRKTHERT